MALKSKTGVIGIVLATVVAVASLIFLGCVVKHHYFDHDYHHAQGMTGHGDLMHGEEHGEMHNGTFGDDADGTGIVIENGYARANGASAKAGAAFMVIKNDRDADDRLVSITTNVADKAELHTHTVDAYGVAKMGPIEGGLKLPAHSAVALKRGGDHVMMMGLKQPLNQGDVVTLFLEFENAGTVIVKIPVDLNR